MPFPYTFPIVFTGVITLTGNDSGIGADSLTALIQKSGSDLKLRGQRGHVEIPHKEISL